MLREGGKKSTNGGKGSGNHRRMYRLVLKCPGAPFYYCWKGEVNFKKAVCASMGQMRRKNQFIG